MAAYICTKPKGSCASCPHYRYDKEREDNACFVKQDMLEKPSFETYKEAIASGNIELAQEIYKQIFKK